MFTTLWNLEHAGLKGVCPILHCSMGKEGFGEKNYLVMHKHFKKLLADPKEFCLPLQITVFIYVID